MENEGVNSLLYEVLSLAAFDTIEELSSDEIATLNRDLGQNWRQQLLTPITQPMTLRSGTILGSLRGGGCPVAVKFFARVVLMAFMTLFMMAALQPYVNPAMAIGSQYWVAVKDFSSEVWGLAKSCPVGYDVPLWKNAVCGGYSQILKELQLNTIGTLQKVTEVFRNVGLGTGGLTISMAGVYSFVRHVIKSGDAMYITALDAMCYVIGSVGKTTLGITRMATNALTSSSKVKASTVVAPSSIPPEHLIAIQQLLLHMAKNYKTDMKQIGGIKTKRTSIKRKSS